MAEKISKEIAEELIFKHAVTNIRVPFTITDVYRIVEKSKLKWDKEKTNQVFDELCDSGLVESVITENSFQVFRVPIEKLFPKKEEPIVR